MKKGCLLLTLGIIGAAVVVNIIFSIRGTFVAKPHEIAGPRERESKVEGKKTSGEPKAEKSEAPKKSPFRELYSIISDKPTGTVKRSVDVRLKEKVNEKTIEGIAKEIHDSNPQHFKRTFIVYYLPEQTVGAGGWATSHFNPTLEVNVIGLSAGSEAEKATVSKVGETEIGRWEYSAPPGFMVFVLKTKEGIALRRVFGDGSSLVEKVKISLKGDEILLMPVEVNEAGDHWVLDSDGNLRLMDNDGLIGKAVVSGEKRGSEQFKEAFGFKEEQGIAEEPKAKVTTIFDSRTWTSADGQQTFVGAFTNFQNGKVTIVKDEEPLTFSAEILSQADREFLGQGVTFTTEDGKSYENVSASKISASAVTFMSSSGMATIPMEQLPKDMRARFGYDPAKAATEREALTKGQAAYRAQLAAQQKAVADETARKAELAKAERMTFKIFQIVPGKGALANEYRRGGVAGSVARAINSITGSGSSNYVAPSTGDVVFLTGNLHAGIVDETILDAAVVPDGIYQYTTTLGATKTVTKYKVLEMKAD